MSRPRGEVRRIMPAIQQRLDARLLAYTGACAQLAANELGGAPPGRVGSPAMSNAVALWRAEVDEAITRLNRTSSRARGRALALEAMNTLALALVHLSESMSLADANAARESADKSLATLATYQRLNGRLARVLR